MIRIEGTRFGAVEVDEGTVIEFPNGLVGFPAETRFVLLERSGGKLVGYLQSLATPSLAFPVMDGATFEAYPDPSAEELAGSVGLECADLAVLVIVSVNPQTRFLQANLLAPLLVDVVSRVGAQCVLDPRRFSAAHVLADPIAVAKARIEAARARKPEPSESADEGTDKVAIGA
ncbi:MAG: flagellar assembly protein FliW [Deltaproteobacteria bacterium]|nr:flagellar assembly protein FliW [Deltaproteobacteria bacterium]